MRNRTLAKPRVILAGCLRSDGWVSMAEYETQVRENLRKYEDDFEVRVFRPFGHALRSVPLRAVVRRLVYPMHLRLALGVSRGRTLLHVMGQFYAYLLGARGARAVTCHDLAEYKYTDLSEAQLRRWKRRVACVSRARLIFSDSHSTAAELREILNVDAGKIIVNHLGVSADFRRLPDGYAFSPSAVRLKELSKTDVLALHIGSNLTRKNVPLMLKAIAWVRAAGVPIRLVRAGDYLCGNRQAAGKRHTVEERDGKYGPMVRELGLEDRVIDLGRVDRRTLRELYNVCSLFLFPSLYEGFGFPVLEAQASGCPCVIARASSLPEVGGNAVLYHDPANAGEMADCILRLVREPGLRPSLISKGFENAGKFTWEAHADRLVRGYRRMLGMAAAT